MNFGKSCFSCASGVVRFGIVTALILVSAAHAASVARVGNAEYESLNEAIQNSLDSETVTLLADATLSVESIAKDITLDTAGHDMTISGPNYLYIDGNVVFTNSVYNAADPTASGVVLVTTYGVCPYTGGSLTIANGRYEQTVDDRYLFYTMGGSLVINDGSFDALYSVVNTYVRNDGKTNGFGGTVTVNGGDFHVGTSLYQTIIRANQGATVTINGGTFDADGGYVMISSTVAGNSAAPASISVNDGTFADGVIISANDTSITIADGMFTQIELATCDDSSIAIGGGLFTQTELEAYDDSSIAISGGLFDSVVPEELCAEGCIPSTETTNVGGVEYYTVKQGAYVAAVYDGNKDLVGKYDSLASAIAAVPTDGTETTIEMLEDVAVTNVAHTIAAGQNIVLDLSGKTIDGFCNTGSNFAFITNNGTLVIQDSSDAAADGTGDGKLLFAASPAWIWDGSDNYSGSYYSDLILNSGSGEVTVRSGYVAIMLPGNACYAIDTGNPAANAHIAINVEGGHIWATNTAIRINVRKNGANDYAFRMTDGTVEGVSCAIAVNNSVSGVDVDVTVEGGSIIGWKEAYYGAIDNAGPYGCDLTITGGDFVGGICLVGDSTVDISGGTFNGNVAGNSYFLFDEIESASISGGLYGDLSYWMRPLGVISGGLFATRPFNGYIAPGFFLVDNTDPTTAATYPYAVVPAKAMVLFGTGTVTTNYFSSVVEAFTVATGKTVVMLGDETLTNAVTVSSTSTLDLAGHAIDRSNGTANAEDGSVFVVDGGNLSITNSVGSGKITSTSSKGYTLWVKNNGTVSVQDGVVEAASASTSRHAIYVASGTANVSGGLVRCLQNSSAIYILSGAVNVTGGEVTTPGTAIYGSGTEVTVNVAHATVSSTGDYSYGIQLAKSSVANITNSVVSGGYAGVGAMGASSVANIFHGSTVSGSVNNGVYVSSGGTANIYGGTMTGTANGIYVTKGTANVSGGTITGTGSGSYGILVDNNAGVANVSDGQIAGETSVAVASGRTGTVSLTGGVYSTEPAATYVAEGYTTVSLEDGWYMVVPGYTYTYPEGGPITDEGLVNWLHGHGNTQGQVDALLTNAKLEECYYLNCDITQAGAGGGIALTSIALSNGSVTIGVRLSRTGAYDDGGIKGNLYIYGAETLGGEFSVVGAAEIADADFSEGNDTLAVFSADDVSARFFKAVVK